MKTSPAGFRESIVMYIVSSLHVNEPDGTRWRTYLDRLTVAQAESLRVRIVLCISYLLIEL